MAQLRYLPGVVTLRLDTSACNGCGICGIVCPHGVFRVEAGKAVIVDRDACIECGACVLNCPANALSVESGAGCAGALLIDMARGRGKNGEGPTCGCG